MEQYGTVRKHLSRAKRGCMQLERERAFEAKLILFNFIKEPRALPSF